jgi:putative hemolysin
VLANGVFSGAEIAILSVRKTRLRQLVEQGSRRAAAVEQLRKEPERFLATVQIGITLVGTTASAFGGASVAARLTELFTALGLGAQADDVALFVVVAVIAFLSIVVGELVPKSLALRSAEAYALLLSRPLLGMAWLTRPMVWSLTAASNVFLRLFGDKTSFTEGRLSPDELRQLVEQSATAGELDPRTGEIASRAFDFGTLKVGAAMIPREKMISVPKNTTTVELTRVLGESGHARLPVYEGTPDNIIGYVTAREVFVQLSHQREVVVADIMRTAYFVPQSMGAMDALRQLQGRRMHMAIVVDDQGALVGLVTIEDMVEELVGEIMHEHEVPSLLTRDPDGSTMVAGNTQVREVNRALDLELPEGDWSTMAGLAIALAGGIPRPGDALKAQDGSTIEVLEASPRKVQKLRIRPPVRARAQGEQG